MSVTGSPLRRWLNGDCRFGDRCNFAHGETELRNAPGRGRGRGRGANSRTAAAGRGFGSQGSGASYEGQVRDARMSVTIPLSERFRNEATACIHICVVSGGLRRC